MIHIPFFLPLVLGGFVGAAWRDYRQVKPPLLNRLSLPQPVSATGQPQLMKAKPVKLFDDMGELHHYQRVSWYAFACALSGVYFFPPAVAIAVPLLSYNAYNYYRTIGATDAASQKSAITVFELISLTGTIVTGRPVMASLMFLFVFGYRNLMLQTRSLANAGLLLNQDSDLERVWVWRDEAELELSLNELDRGDIIVFHAGDLMLIEGVVVKGEGVASQYSLQKCLKSVPKQVGDMVFRFTQLESGCLYIQLT